MIIVKKPKILHNKYHYENEEKPIVDANSKVSEDFHGGDEVTESVNDQRFAVNEQNNQNSEDQQIEDQQNNQQSEKQKEEENEQQNNTSSHQNNQEQQLSEEQMSEDQNEEDNNQQTEQQQNSEEEQNNEQSSEEQTQEEDNNQETEQQNNDNIDHQQTQDDNNEDEYQQNNQANDQQSSDHQTQQNQQQTEQQNNQNSEDQQSEEEQNKEDQQTNNQQSEEQNNTNIENKEKTEDQQTQDDQQKLDQKQNTSQSEEQQNSKEENEQSEDDEENYDEDTSDDEDDDYESEENNEQENTTEYNTEEVAEISKKSRIMKKKLYLAFYRLVEYLADEEKVPSLMPGQSVLLNIRKLMFRQYEHKPVSSYYYYRARSQIVLILDNSGSMDWLVEELNTFFNVALKRKDVQIYIAPNGNIEKYYDFRKKDFIEINHEDAMNQIRQSSLPIIYIGDFDGANTPIELSWSNRTYWICPETRYKYFRSHDWVKYSEEDFRGFFGRAFDDEEMIEVLQQFSKNIMKQRFWYDKHDENEFEDYYN